MAWNFYCLVGFSMNWDSGTRGKKFPYCPGTKVQQDKLKILAQDRPGWDFLTYCKKTGQDRIFIIFDKF